MNFCQIHKKYLWTSDNMSIENRQNICYNEITKEVKSNEKLNFRISIFWLWWKGRKSERKNLQIKFSEKMFFDFMSKPNVKKERTKNDVRYQDRTEITLDCVWQNVIKGYFILKIFLISTKIIYRIQNMFKRVFNI